MSAHPFLLLLGAIVGLSAVPAARAQSIAMQGVAAHSGQSLLGSLYGGAVVVGVPLRADLLSLQVGATRLTGNTNRIGPACGGFILPGACPDEPLRDDARVTHFSLGLGLRVWRRDPVTVSFVSGLRAARVQADTRGLTTGQTISASKTLWGAELGVEAVLVPWRRRPVALRLGAGAMGLMPYHNEDNPDQYAPFNQFSSLTSVWLGVVLQRHPSR